MRRVESWVSTKWIMFMLNIGATYAGRCISVGRCLPFKIDDSNKILFWSSHQMLELNRPIVIIYMRNGCIFGQADLSLLGFATWQANWDTIEPPSTPSPSPDWQLLVTENAWLDWLCGAQSWFLWCCATPSVSSKWAEKVLNVGWWNEKWLIVLKYTVESVVYM